MKWMIVALLLMPLTCLGQGKKFKITPKKDVTLTRGAFSSRGKTKSVSHGDSLIVIKVISESSFKTVDANSNFYRVVFAKDVIIPNDLSDWIKSGGIENQALSERRASLQKKYGKVAAEKILKKQYWVGMTEDMAMESIGAPDTNNVSEGSWGIHKQWVYRNKAKYSSTRDIYLYFENGVLKSIQD